MRAAVLPGVKKPMQNSLLAVALLLGVGALFFFNPSTAGFYPKCLFHEVTGLYCPGCGTTRALHSLLRGELREALHDNALAILALPLVVGFFLTRTVRRQPPVMGLRFRPIWIAILLMVIAAFGVLRNIPARPFNLLAPPVETAGK